MIDQGARRARRALVRPVTGCRNPALPVSSTFTRDTYTSVYPEVARAAAESAPALINTSAAGARRARLITLPDHIGDATS